MNYSPISYEGLEVTLGPPDVMVRQWEHEERPRGIRATPFKWVAPSSLPRRRWIYGRHYLRKFLTTTTALAGVGKSSLGLVEALAIATGRDLLGVLPDEQTNVWLWNGEDPLEEMQRRVIAAAVHYGIDPSEIEGRLFVDSGRDTEIVVAEQTKSGTVINAPVVAQIKKTIRENGIGLMIVDPFVSSHRVTENDNGAIDLVAKSWAKIADETGCAIELVHHSRKTGGALVTVEDTRGAGALIGAARSARVLNGMSDDEAAKAGVDNRRLFFRVENGKANLAAPADKADWYKLASVDLGNGDDCHPGDAVGVATTWQWPNPLDDVTVDQLRAAQRAVADGGPWRENSQAGDWVGKPIAQALKLDIGTKQHKQKIVGLLRIWMENGMFVRVVGKDQKRMEKTFVEVGQWATD